MPLSKVKAKDALAKRHERNISAFFRQQKTLVIRALNRRSLSAPKGKARELESPPFNMAPEVWDKIWGEVVKQSTGQLKAVITAAEADGLHAGADQFGLAFQGPTPTGSTFNLANPRAVSWFQQNGGSVDYIAGIQETTGNQIKTIIEAGITEGKSYTQVAKEISQTFDEFSKDRARLIAITEIGKAYEEGNMNFAQSLKDAGITMVKRWETSKDDKVSDGCQENEDEDFIPIDQYHRSGDQQPPRFPGCRCYESYEQKQGD